MKGLPYFKFTSDNWLTGDIYFEPFDIQGLFISVCSIYWSKQDVTLQSLKLRLPTATEEQWKRLQDGGYISFKNGNLVIKFLDEQVSELSEQHQKKVESGRKGGQASVKHRLSNAQASVEHIDKDVDTDKEKDKDKDSNRPPSLSEVEEYFVSNGYTKESAKKMFDYYQASMGESGRVWKDGKGNTVKNWKQKAQAVWFKDENKAVKEAKPYRIPL